MKDINTYIKEGFFDNINANSELSKLMELGFKEIEGCDDMYYFESDLTGYIHFRDSDYDIFDIDGNFNININNPRFYLIPRSKPRIGKYTLFMVSGEEMFEWIDCYIGGFRYDKFGWTGGPFVKQITKDIFKKNNYIDIIDQICDESATLPEADDVHIGGKLKDFLNKLFKIKTKEIKK